MTIQYGFLLFFLGTTITILGMVVALYIGSKKPKEVELNEVEKSINKLKESR